MSETNNDLALQSLVESLQETLRKERIRTETLELENAQLHARVIEFEASPTEPPPASERPTSRSGALLELAIAIDEQQKAVANLASVSELNGRILSQLALQVQSVTESVSELKKAAQKMDANQKLIVIELRNQGLVLGTQRPSLELIKEAE
jgi:hypothetical protein